MHTDVFKHITIEKLKELPLDENARKALDILGKVQLDLAAMSEKHGEEELTAIKAGTILAFAVVKKIFNGKSPKEFGKDDWADIASAVSEYAVRLDDQSYTEFVFLLYAEYIEFSVQVVSGKISEDSEKNIRVFPEEIRRLTELLRTGELPEKEYIEKCLWISLEAMIKLLSSYLGVVAGENAEKLSVAAASLAFEYGRLSLWKQEQLMLTQFLEQQGELDAKLEEQYRIFVNQLNEESTKFMHLIEHAFDADFKERLSNSVSLAMAAGVPKSEILDSTEKIDDYFLN